MLLAEVLEFDALRALLGRYVRSALGRDELARVAPSSDRVSIENALAEAAEGMEYLRSAASASAFSIDTRSLDGATRASSSRPKALRT